LGGKFIEENLSYIDDIKFSYDLVSRVMPTFNNAATLTKMKNENLFNRD